VLPLRSSTSLVDHLEEGVGLPVVEGRDADVVDDEHARVRVGADLLDERALGPGIDQCLGHIRSGPGADRPVALPDELEGEAIGAGWRFRRGWVCPGSFDPGIA
jgi:hypothetical protein